MTLHVFQALYRCLNLISISLLGIPETPRLNTEHIQSIKTSDLQGLEIVADSESTLINFYSSPLCPTTHLSHQSIKKVMHDHGYILHPFFFFSGFTLKQLFTLLANLRHKLFYQNMPFMLTNTLPIFQSSRAFFTKPLCSHFHKTISGTTNAN